MSCNDFHAGETDCDLRHELMSMLSLSFDGESSQNNRDFKRVAPPASSQDEKTVERIF